MRVFVSFQDVSMKSVGQINFPRLGVAYVFGFVFSSRRLIMPVFCRSFRPTLIDETEKPPEKTFLQKWVSFGGSGPM